MPELSEESWYLLVPNRPRGKKLPFKDTGGPDIEKLTFKNTVGPDITAEASADIGTGSPFPFCQGAMLCSLYLSTILRRGEAGGEAYSREADL